MPPTVDNDGALRTGAAGATTVRPRLMVVMLVALGVFLALFFIGRASGGSSSAPALTAPAVLRPELAQGHAPISLGRAPRQAALSAGGAPVQGVPRTPAQGARGAPVQGVPGAPVAPAAAPRSAPSPAPTRR